jgi:TatD DNase family protein
MKSIIDSHAHLTWDTFGQDQAAVIERAFKEGVVQIVQAGVDLQSIPEMIKVSDQYESIYFGVGIHPHEAKFWSQEAESALKAAAGHPKMVAVGECGLDYYYNHSDRQAQQAAFRAQVRLARTLGKPLIIHTRDAWEETFEILDEEKAFEVGGVFHCFTGGPEVVARIKALDFYVSFSGIVTFKNAKPIQEAAPLFADDRILVETDCPYLAPLPHRGKRNEPSYVWFVAQKLADLRAVELASLAAQTAENTRRLFRLPAPDGP